MPKKNGLCSAATIVYAAVVVLFAAFFLYLSFCESADIYKARDTQSGFLVENCIMTEIRDESAPVGIRQEYRWTLRDTGKDEICLCFYLVHQYADVYFADELMYSLRPDETNRIAHGVSSNWVAVPIYSEDAGKEVRVIVTPVYQSAVKREITFQIGSHYAVFTAQLRNDLPQLIIGVLCILIGLFIMTVHVTLIAVKKTKIWDIFFLGLLSVIIGIWRLTDTRMSPFLFPHHTLELGYLSIGMLFLCQTPMLLFIWQRYSLRKGAPFFAASLVTSAIALGVLCCQVFGFAEFKQTLFLSHIGIGLAVLTILGTVAFDRSTEKEPAPGSFGWVILLILGVLTDIILFYVSGNSSKMFFTVTAFLIYLVILFTTNLLAISRKSYTDMQTGLLNKTRWDDLMKRRENYDSPVGVMLLDLNRLKFINDTFGHETGDKLILDFAELLRRALPVQQPIFRWGGDEFTLFVTDATDEKMQRYLTAIGEAVEAYNADGADPALSFAAGYAISSEQPGLTKKDLLKLADERMYRNKQQWHQNRRPAEP